MQILKILKRILKLFQFILGEYTTKNLWHICSAMSLVRINHAVTAQPYPIASQHQLFSKSLQLFRLRPSCVSFSVYHDMIKNRYWSVYQDQLNKTKFECQMCHLPIVYYIFILSMKYVCNECYII